MSDETDVWTQALLASVANLCSGPREIAFVYRKAILRGPRPDWAKVDAAILNRFTPEILEDIKTRAARGMSGG